MRTKKSSQKSQDLLGIVLQNTSFNSHLWVRKKKKKKGIRCGIWFFFFLLLPVILPHSSLSFTTTISSFFHTTVVTNRFGKMFLFSLSFLSSLPLTISTWQKVQNRVALNLCTSPHVSLSIDFPHIFSPCVNKMEGRERIDMTESHVNYDFQISCQFFLSIHLTKYLSGLRLPLLLLTKWDDSSWFLHVSRLSFISIYMKWQMGSN